MIYKYILLFFFFFLILILYFRIANYFNIIDKPNERSSHSYITVRGAGIIFFISVTIFFLLHKYLYADFYIGILIICTISFLDDIFSLPNIIRLVFQSLAVIILFFQFKFSSIGLVGISFIFVIIIALLNAYNFMDGINGITGAYSLSILLPFLYLNYIIKVINKDLILFVIIADIVFLYFNYRRRAKCFAGDVGSICMAFILVFITILFILFYKNYLFIMFFAVYGIDSAFTIVNRIIIGENIFKAHRKHLYQLLVNEKAVSPLKISFYYSIVQLSVNMLVIINLNKPVSIQYLSALFVLIILGSSYSFLRFRIIHC
jgi:UDP-GlcNAc:undecaprenyl-phosphate GlcNAc-1-phosphate transferase